MLNTSTFENFDNNSYSKFCGPAQLERDLNILYGFLAGIQSDKEINDLEIQSLLNWVNSVQHCRDKYPYKILVEKITDVLEDGLITNDESDDLLWLCGQYLNHNNPYYNVITSRIQQLSGLVSGIIADRVINQSELLSLEAWLSENYFLSGTWPFDDLVKAVSAITNEKSISTALHNELLKFCDVLNVIPGSDNKSNGKKLVESVQTDGIQIFIPESSFCLTGASKRFTRKQIADIVEMYGGIIQNSVSGKLHYLVVCDDKNACWAFASYGRKVEKAIQLKAQGTGPHVIYEEDLFKCLMSLGYTH
jgi:hypothetical protein